MPNVRFQTRTDENGERRLGVHVLKRKVQSDNASTPPAISFCRATPRWRTRMRER